MAEKPKTTPKKPPEVKFIELPLVDEFAKAALSGALWQAHRVMTIRQSRQIAEACYLIAEAMVEEREKHGE